MDSKEKKRLSGKAYYERVKFTPEFRAKCNAYRKIWRKQNPESDRRSALKYYYKHREREKLQRREWGQERKLKVLTHYGGGELVCVQCGESRLACLSLDHLNGGGNIHRKSIGGSGYAFYKWIIEHNYPEGYQTLCMNCQWVKREVNGECLQ